MSVSHLAIRRIIFTAVLGWTAALTLPLQTAWGAWSGATLTEFKVAPLGIANILACKERSSSKDFAGEAALVFFYFGDSYIETLIQETVDLSLPFAHADYKVLLHDENADIPELLTLDGTDEADEILEPTQGNFRDALRDLVDAGYVVSIYIFAHGGSYANSLGEEVAYFSTLDGNLTENEVLDEFADRGCAELPIRMTYTVSCWHKYFNDTWSALGAKVTSGARSINFYPNQYPLFVSEWNDGKTYSTALSNSNTSNSREFIQSIMWLDGLFYANQGECGDWPNVLGENDCAEWYFTGGGPYDLEDTYDPDKSGKSNMNYGSKKIVSGDGTIKWNTELSWKRPR